MYQAGAFLTLLVLLLHPVKAQINYINYHLQVVEAERSIVIKDYGEALIKLEDLFDRYPFVFLREFQLASQLSVMVGDSDKAFRYIEQGLKKGWRFKEIKNNALFASLKEDPKWSNMKSGHKSFGQNPNINQPLREEVRELLKKDQKMAFGALFRLGDKARDKYGIRKFAPHSEQQLAKLQEILREHGYPGEQLIGNNYWVSTIISHHNSSSKEYVLNDSLYKKLRPLLIHSLEQGQISLFEFAIMEDWKTAVENDHGLSSFGIIGAIPHAEALTAINNNRQKIGMRSIGLRNELVEIEMETGMDLYLSGGPWQPGKIKTPD